MTVINRENQPAADPLNDDLTLRLPRSVDTADELTERLEDMAFVMRRIGNWIDVYAGELGDEDGAADLVACSGLMRVFGRDLSEAAIDLGNRIYCARKGRPAN